MPINLPIVSKFYDKGIKDAESSLGKLGKLAGATAAAATAAIAGIAVGSIKAFAGFDSKMNQSLAIMGDVSEAMRNDMSDAAREVAKTTTFSAEEAAESYFFLASAGLDAAASIAAMPQVAKFAQAGMFDMATATDLATDAQSALGLASKDPAENLENLTRITDVFVKANTLANTSVEQLATAFTTKAGTALKTVGKDVEEGAAALALFADQGVKGELAGTQLTNTIFGLTDRANKVPDAFAELGLSVFDAEGNMRNFADIADDFGNVLGDMTTEQKVATLSQLGFTKQARNGLLMISGQGDALRKYEGELKSAGGLVDEVSGKQLQTMSAQFEILKSRVADVGIEIGGKLAPSLLDLFDRLSPIIDKAGPAFVALFIALTPAFEGLLSLVPLLADLLIPVVESLGTFIRDVLVPSFEAMFGFISDNLATVGTFVGVLASLVGVIKLWSNATKIAAAAQAVLTAVMAVNPLYLLAIAVAAVAAGIVYLATQTTFFQDLWQTVTTAIGDAWNFLWENALKPVFDAISTAFTFLYEKVILPVVTAIFVIIGLWAALFQWLYETIIEPILREIGIGFEKLYDNVIEPVTKFIGTALGVIGDAFTMAWTDFIKPALKAIGDAFKWVYDNIIKPVSEWINGTIENVGKAFRDVFQGVSDFMRDVFAKLVNYVKVPLNAIIGFINKVIGALNTIQVSIPDWVPLVGGRTFGINLPRVPQLADGGIVMPQPGGVLANIAEGGQPEAVIPLDRFDSFGSSTNNYNINVTTGVATDPVSVGREVVNAIKRYESTNGRVFAGA